MKSYMVKFGGTVEVMAESVDEALEETAYQCLCDPINVMKLRVCEDQDENKEGTTDEI